MSLHPTLCFLKSFCSAKHFFPSFSLTHFSWIFYEKNKHCRHHAQKDMAAGFCIINDIVLGIMELQKNFSRILYLDLDVHHGDGVERAFQYTDKVLTVSLHHFAEGFYPGTGSGNRSAVPARTRAVVNLPLKSGLCRATLARIFDQLIEPLVASFHPEAVVLQCGVDGMSRMRESRGDNNTSPATDPLKGGCKIVVSHPPFCLILCRHDG